MTCAIRPLHSRVKFIYLLLITNRRYRHNSSFTTILIFSHIDEMIWSITGYTLYFGLVVLPAKKSTVGAMNGASRKGPM